MEDRKEKIRMFSLHGNPQGNSKRTTDTTYEMTPVANQFLRNDHSIDQLVATKSEDTPGFSFDLIQCSCGYTRNCQHNTSDVNNLPGDVIKPVKSAIASFHYENTQELRSNLTQATGFCKKKRDDSAVDRMVVCDFSFDFSAKKGSTERQDGMLNLPSNLKASSVNGKNEAFAFLDNAENGGLEGSMQSQRNQGMSKWERAGLPGGQYNIHTSKDPYKREELFNYFDSNLLQVGSGLGDFETGLGALRNDSWMSEISGVLDNQNTATGCLGVSEMLENTAVGRKVETEYETLNPKYDSHSSHMGTREIGLLMEALQTRSFEPIAYLLSFALADRMGNVEPNQASIRQVPTLSPQQSYESDQSSVWSDNQARPSLSDCSTDSEDAFVGSQSNFLAFENASSIFGSDSFNPREEKSQSEKKNINLFTLTSEEKSNDANMELDIVGVIDDIIRSETKCDLRTFQRILNRTESDEVDAGKERMQTKVWKNVSTNTNEQLKKEADADSDIEFHGNNEADDEMKREKKSANHRPGPNKCYHLWDFLKEVLDSPCPPGTEVVQWINRANGEFKLTDTKRLAELWGQKKKLSNMNYDKLSRSLRYYIKLDILRKVPGKRLHFKFGKGRMWRKMKK